MSFVTEEAVRKYILDLTFEHNDLAEDLRFASEDVEQAMESCAREFNGIFPQVLCVQAHTMPMDTNCFLDGTVAALLRMHIIRLAGNDLDYNAGNMSVNVDGKQMQHYRELQKDYQARFKDLATNIKLTKNLYDGFGQVG